MRRRNSTLESDGPPRKKISGSNSIPSIDIKPGEVLTDLTGKKWKLGKAIGIGGFGEIFLASDIEDRNSEVSPSYVAKVETHDNGPLFVEINCYLRIARKHMIEEWNNKNALDSLGMPVYIASGSHVTKNSKLRFLILPRFEKDLEQIFQSKRRKFNLKTVLLIAVQLIDTLEYIHSNGYVHSDIKASNILLQQSRKDKVTKNVVVRHTGSAPLRSCRIKKLVFPHLLRSTSNIKYFELSDDTCTKRDIDQVYLLDYGLAAKYILCNGEHKAFCSDERKAHAGTILFCSLDAHKGAQSRRSDLESLGYNLVYWLTSKLPWIDDTEEPELVHRKKQHCLANLEEFLKSCFSDSYPRFLYDYFKYLVELEFDAQPDYNYCRMLFEKALHEHGYKKNCKFDFDNLEGWGKKQKKTKVNSENRKSSKFTYKLNRIPLTSNLPVRPKLRKNTKNKKLNKLNWSKILTDPEVILKQRKTRDRKLTENSDHSTTVMNLDINQLNPTYAMIDVYNKSLDRINSGCSPRYKGDSSDCLEGFTPAMMLVYNRKREREEMEIEKIAHNNRKANKASCQTKTGSRLRKPVAEISRTRNSKSMTDIKKDVTRKQKPVVSARVYRLRG